MFANTNTVKISKIPNGCGNYSCQYYDLLKNKWCIVTFKSYGDAVTSAYFSGLTKECHLQLSLILERE